MPPGIFHLFSLHKGRRGVGVPARSCSALPRAALHPRPKASPGLSDPVWASGSLLHAHTPVPHVPHPSLALASCGKALVPARLQAAHWAGAENTEGWFKRLTGERGKPVKGSPELTPRQLSSPGNGESLQPLLFF